MRFLWTFIWSLLLSSAVVYVISNMATVDFSFNAALFLAVVFTIIVSVLGEGILKEDDVH
ncbi:Protein of unknown function [Salinibacillus kushneri]|uniref:DUF2929 domain-containing protein n=1 Tax=Salinibacillus kushneri TaxID=237682 RepID=A0A1I0J0V1_9BACI|nr:YjzD family protein [Salinibacillus kushneri]SEU03362.1 Protein of unknown function [Salinibacillus kushneri]